MFVGVLFGPWRFSLDTKFWPRNIISYFKIFYNHNIHSQETKENGQYVEWTVPARRRIQCLARQWFSTTLSIHHSFVSVHLQCIFSVILYPANIVPLPHSLASLAWQTHLQSFNLFSLKRPHRNNIWRFGIIPAHSTLHWAGYSFCLGKPQKNKNLVARPLRKKLFWKFSSYFDLI